MKYYIKNPCHQPFNKMKPTDMGRFCDHCSKTVVDFRNKSKDEIQNYLLSNPNSCGSFYKSQLQPSTPIQHTGFNTFKNVLITGILLTSISTYEMNAQEPQKVNRAIIRPITPASQINDTVKSVINKEYTIKGTVVDENDDPMPFVNVYIEDFNTGVPSNIDGLFELKISVPADQNNILIKYSCVGYENDSILYNLDENKELNIQLSDSMIKGMIVGMVVVEQTPIKRTLGRIRGFFWRLFH